MPICHWCVVHLFGLQPGKNHLALNLFLTETVNNILISFFMNTV